MPAYEDYKAEFDEILVEWNKAEQDIKIAEQIGGKVVFPSIKELRYAGRRVVDVLTKLGNGGTDAEIRALLADAKFDCYRARHDAVDAAVAIMNLELEAAVKKLGYDPVLKGFPAYVDLANRIHRAQRKIAESRSVGPGPAASAGAANSSANAKHSKRIVDPPKCKKAPPAEASGARVNPMRRRRNFYASRGGRRHSACRWT